MKLEGWIRLEGDVRTASAEAPTYEEAKVQLESQVGDGAQLLSIRRLEE